MVEHSGRARPNAHRIAREHIDHHLEIAGVADLHQWSARLHHGLAFLQHPQHATADGGRANLKTPIAAFGAFIGVQHRSPGLLQLEACDLERELRGMRFCARMVAAAVTSSSSGLVAAP